MDLIVHLVTVLSRPTSRDPGVLSLMLRALQDLVPSPLPSSVPSASASRGRITKQECRTLLTSFELLDPDVHIVSYAAPWISAVCQLLLSPRPQDNQLQEDDENEQGNEDEQSDANELEGRFVDALFQYWTRIRHQQEDVFGSIKVPDQIRKRLLLQLFSWYTTNHKDDDHFEFCLQVLRGWGHDCPQGVSLRGHLLRNCPESVSGAQLTALLPDASAECRVDLVEGVVSMLVGSKFSLPHREHREQLCQWLADNARHHESLSMHVLTRLMPILNVVVPKLAQPDEHSKASHPPPKYTRHSVAFMLHLLLQLVSPPHKVDEPTKQFLLRCVQALKLSDLRRHLPDLAPIYTELIVRFYLSSPLVAAALAKAVREALSPVNVDILALLLHILEGHASDRATADDDRWARLLLLVPDVVSHALDPVPAPNYQVVLHALRFLHLVLLPNVGTKLSKTWWDQHVWVYLQATIKTALGRPSRLPAGHRQLFSENVDLVCAVYTQIGLGVLQLPPLWFHERFSLIGGKSTRSLVDDTGLEDPSMALHLLKALYQSASLETGSNVFEDDSRAVLWLLGFLDPRSGLEDFSLPEYAPVIRKTVMAVLGSENDKPVSIARLCQFLDHRHQDLGAREWGVVLQYRRRWAFLLDDWLPLIDRLRTLHPCAETARLEVDDILNHL
jgi:hypothetical protein